MRTSLLIAILLIALTVVPGWMGLRHFAPGAPSQNDGVLDAKRKAAAQLLRDGKASDAITILAEVLQADDSHYGDHLLMARACEKTSQTTEALAHYQRVLELLPGSPANADDRQARLDAEKRIKQLDPLGGKIEATVTDFLTKLDGLEREAISGRNMSSLARIFRLRGMTWQAVKAKDRGYAEVFAAQPWQDSGLEVKEKQSYRVRAAGVWYAKLDNGSFAPCTAGGTDKRKVNWTTTLKVGQLQGQIAGVKYVDLGEDVVFTAPVSGPLNLIFFDAEQKVRVNNKGSIQVLIEPVPR